MAKYRFEVLDEHVSEGTVQYTGKKVDGSEVQFDTITVVMTGLAKGKRKKLTGRTFEIDITEK